MYLLSRKTSNLLPITRQVCWLVRTSIIFSLQTIMHKLSQSKCKISFDWPIFIKISRESWLNFCVKLTTPPSASKAPWQHSCNVWTYCPVFMHRRNVTGCSVASVFSYLAESTGQPRLLLIIVMGKTPGWDWCSCCMRFGTFVTRNILRDQVLSSSRLTINWWFILQLSYFCPSVATAVLL